MTIREIYEAAIQNANGSQFRCGTQIGEVNGHQVSCYVYPVNTNSKNEWRKQWKVDGKVISEKNLDKAVSV